MIFKFLRRLKRARVSAGSEALNGIQYVSNRYSCVYSAMTYPFFHSQVGSRPPSSRDQGTADEGHQAVPLSIYEEISSAISPMHAGTGVTIELSPFARSRVSMHNVHNIRCNSRDSIPSLSKRLNGPQPRPSAILVFIRNAQTRTLPWSHLEHTMLRLPEA